MRERVCEIPNKSSACYFLLRRLEKSAGNLLFLSAPREFDYPDYAGIMEAFSAAYARKDFEVLFWGEDDELNVKTLNFLSAEKNAKSAVVFSSPEHLPKKVMAPADYGKARITLNCDSAVDRNALITRLLGAGYVRTRFVENKGEFAVRGAVLDVFPVGARAPFRIFFSGNSVYSIRDFEIESQHTFKYYPKIEIDPVRISGGSDFFSTRIGENFEIILDKSLFREDLDPRVKERVRTEIIPLREEGAERAGFSRNINFNSDANLVEKEIRRLFGRKYLIDVFCINKGEEERMGDILRDHGVREMVAFRTGNVDEGFVREAEKKAVLSVSEIFNRHYRTRENRGERKGKFFKWSDLKKGDFVVHEDYGIGRHLGINEIKGLGQKTECLLIEYSRGDKLMVPLGEFGKVQKYMSSEGKTPKLSSMDGRRWTELKNRVRGEVQTLAREILKTEAARKAFRTRPMTHGGQMEDEFASSFPFEETRDQRRAIESVLRDLETGNVVNRIIVGDVGFGKTEVAMRAAMRCVLNGGQAAVLVPTTVLCQQHWRNFAKRFKGFPVNIAKMSRLESQALLKKTAEEIEKGVCDIVVGTHNLLRKKINFKNLSLLVIDEEHRFGVSDKEKLKKLARGMHLIMLSATPIPRTLHEALSGLKDMSVIETPPRGRLSIETVISPYRAEAVRSAVDRELARGGQIYYVYNRVRSIGLKLKEIKKARPDLRICVLHGQMPKNDIEKNMMDFIDGKYDLLLASSIIESGIDIPRVNTLIVEDSHKFGLAQMYQLRGRIGRSDRKAYCRLFYPAWLKKGGASTSAPEKELTGTAVKRLQALEEFTELGSGYRLAMRDLEIRGSGELLGSRQHGFINSVGLEMYVKLLNAEAEKLRGAEKKAVPREITVDLSVPAFIPADYVNDDMERLNYYKKILNCGPDGLEEIKREMEDLSGKMPREVENLLEVVRLKKESAALGVRRITQKGAAVEIFFSPGSKVTGAVVEKWMKLFGSRISFVPSRLGDGVKIESGDSPLNSVKKALSALKRRGKK